MKQSLIAKKLLTYGTRRLVAGDPFEATPRDARVLVAIGKARYSSEKPKKLPPHDEMAFLRAEYARVSGKRPFMGWDADKLREKIAGATA